MRSFVVLVHRRVETLTYRRLHDRGGAGYRILERLYHLGGWVAEDVISDGFRFPGRRAVDMGTSDTDTDAREVARTEGGDDRFQALVAAITSVRPHPYPPGREIEVVMDNEKVIRVDLPLPERGYHRVTAFVDVGSGLKEDDGRAVDVAFTNCGDGACFELDAVSAREPIDAPVADVVPIMGVLWARVAKSDDQPAVSHRPILAEEGALGGVFRGSADAAGADLEPHRYALDEEGLVLYVRFECAVRPGRFALPASRVLVPDIAAVRSCFGADVTLGHG